jgi:hypothetical protein
LAETSLVLSASSRQFLALNRSSLALSMARDPHLKSSPWLNRPGLVLRCSKARRDDLWRKGIGGWASLVSWLTMSRTQRSELGITTHSAFATRREPMTLTLKRARTSRPDGQWSDEDYDVLADGKVVGRIYGDESASIVRAGSLVGACRA